MIFMLPVTRDLIAKWADNLNMDYLPLSVKIVSVFSLIAIAVWIFLNIKVAKEYTNAVKQRLELKWSRADKVVAEKVDVDYTKLVFDLIESKERSPVLFSMNLFELMKQDKLTPELQELISYNPDEAKASSFSNLFDTDDATWIPEFENQLSEEVLENEIKEIMSLDIYQEVMKNHIDKVIDDKSSDGETAKMEVAKAIGLMDSSSSLIDNLEELIRDSSLDVARYAVESAANIKSREFVPAVIEKLKNPLSREDARSALQKYGSRIVGTLADYLGDIEENNELRKAVASVLALIGTQDAADFLAWELAENRGDLDPELIDALDKIRSERPDVSFSEEIIERKIMRELEAYYNIFIDLYDLKTKEEKEEEIKEIEKQLSKILSGTFELLGIIYSREDIRKAYQNMRSEEKDSVAYAVELLDNMLKKELKDIILPIIEDLSFEEKVRRCKALLKNFSVV